MKKTFYLVAIAFVLGLFAACDDDDKDIDSPIVNPTPKEQWGKTLRGDNQTLLAFPDIFSRLLGIYLFL